MIKYFLAAIALLSPLFFPWPYTIGLTLVAAFFIPPVSLVVGFLSDVLYFAPHANSFPYATLLGVLGFAVALGVHQLIKTRIIG